MDAVLGLEFSADFRPLSAAVLRPIATIAVAPIATARRQRKVSWVLSRGVVIART